MFRCNRLSFTFAEVYIYIICFLMRKSNQAVSNIMGCIFHIYYIFERKIIRAWNMSSQSLYGKINYGQRKRNSQSYCYYYYWLVHILMVFCGSLKQCWKNMPKGKIKQINSFSHKTYSNFYYLFRSNTLNLEIFFIKSN